MQKPDETLFPPVATWQINAMRFLFLLMALVMGSAVWSQLLFESADWPLARGLSKSMLAALALMSLLGVRYPLQMLPLMLYEIAWKTVWILLIAGRAWLAGKWNADIEGLFYDCIGIIIAYFIVPWRFVWARYFRQPMGVTVTVHKIIPFCYILHQSGTNLGLLARLTCAVSRGGRRASRRALAGWGHSGAAVKRLCLTSVRFHSISADSRRGADPCLDDALPVAAETESRRVGAPFGSIFRSEKSDFRVTYVTFVSPFWGLSRRMWSNLGLSAARHYPRRLPASTHIAQRQERRIAACAGCIG